MEMNTVGLSRLKGANFDIDLTSREKISWEQDACPWNEKEGTNLHRCAVKDTSLCGYFCGLEYPDTLVCCYPDENPYKRG
jgi:hypothetical protein